MFEVYIQQHLVYRGRRVGCVTLNVQKMFLVATNRFVAFIDVLVDIFAAVNQTLFSERLIKFKHF